MSVLLETSLGDLVVDLLVDQAPKACENFLKLCKKKYYNYSPVHTIQPNFSLQTGDPLGPGSQDSDGGSSIWGLLPGASISKKTFLPEFVPKLKHTERGTLSMATAPSARDPDQREAGSQFIITLGDSIDYLDGKAAVFGKVVEGFDVLEKINGAFIDHDGRPLKDIRIRHTIVLDEADIPDPAGFEAPAGSPVPSKAQLATVRIADDEEIAEEQDPAALEKVKREREAKAQALTLEMMGDLPFAEVAPPENVLFVCKLNPVTQDADLDLIFSRFGKIYSCEVIRDKRTGDSLQYAFIEFAEKESCERAYHKMEGVLIDDHRIHVDFSQSVSKLADVWRGKRSGTAPRRAGGFGGFDNLEKRRHYRDEEDRAAPRPAYSYVHDRRTGDDDNGSGRARDDHRRRSRSRSRSPHRRRLHDDDGDDYERDHQRRQRRRDYDAHDDYDREERRRRDPYAGRRHRDGPPRDRDRDWGRSGRRY